MGLIDSITRKLSSDKKMHCQGRTISRLLLEKFQNECQRVNERWISAKYWKETVSMVQFLSSAFDGGSHKTVIN